MLCQHMQEWETTILVGQHVLAIELLQRDWYNSHPSIHSVELEHAIDWPNTGVELASKPTMLE